MRTLETTFAGVRMRNPLILASATPGWDGQRCHQAWLHQAGAIVPKSFAPPDKFAHSPRCGRLKIIRHGHSRIGMVNIELYTTIALDEWLRQDLATAATGGSCIIASVVAHPDPAATAANAKVIQDTGKVAMFEINVSCPMPADHSRVGFQMGNDPMSCHDQVKALKQAVSLPVGIKLTPTTHVMVPMAQAAEAAGADFLTIGNSIRAFAGVDITTGLPKLPAFGGYSGPAIKPITQRHVAEVAKAVRIPISACGGVTSWEDVVEYVMLGASTVQVCTSIMWLGYGHFQTLLTGLEDYLDRERLASLEAVRGKALPHIATIEEIAQRPPLVCRVDPERCKNLTQGACEACGAVCFYGAIDFAPRMTVNTAHCDGCNLCVEICPNGALSLVPHA